MSIVPGIIGTKSFLDRRSIMMRHEQRIDGILVVDVRYLEVAIYPISKF